MNDKTGKDPAHPNLSSLTDERVAQKEREEEKLLVASIRESLERSDTIYGETSRLEEYYGISPDELPDEVTPCDAICREIGERTEKLTEMINGSDDSDTGRRRAKRAREEILRLDGDMDRFVRLAAEFDKQWNSFLRAQEKLFWLVGEEEFRRLMFTMELDRDDDEIEDMVVATRGRVFDYPPVIELSNSDMGFLPDDEDDAPR